MKKIISVLVFVYCFSCVFAQEEVKAITSNGDQVILKPDGTWEYVEKPVVPIEILDFTITPRGVNYSLNRYGNDVILGLKVKNGAGYKIKGYRIRVQISNGFGETLHTLQLTSGNSILDVDEIELASFCFEDNQFINNEVYDSLITYSKENLILTILEAIVLK